MDWWRSLKIFISPTWKSGNLPLDTDNFAVDDVDKATVLNTFFAKQSSTDDSTHNIPIDNTDFH